MANFSPKRAGETDIFTVDFVNKLPLGVTIQTAIWSITPVDAPDANAADMIDGSAVVNGSQVHQLITSGVPGVRYAPICTAQTSAGQTIVLPVYGDGQLEVTP